MEKNQITSEIRKLIASGKLETAANELVEYLDAELTNKGSKTQFQLYNQALHQLSQLTEMNHESRTGIASREELDLKRNKIRSVLLEIIGQLSIDSKFSSPGYYSESNTLPTAQRNGRIGKGLWILVGVIAVLLVGFVGWKLGNKSLRGDSYEATALPLETDSTHISTKDSKIISGVTEKPKEDKQQPVKVPTPVKNKSTSVVKVSYSGKNNWTDLANFANAEDFKNVKTGDFNGDGRTDFFISKNNKWYVAFGGVGGWVEINQLGNDSGALMLGDFNGDGKTDVFRSHDSQWYVSYSGVDPWKKLKASGRNPSALKLGDFNGDGKTDVFQSNGGIWYVAYGGVGGWAEINKPGKNLGALMLGDFNGDGKTDVFRSKEDQWYVSYGGVDPWEKLKASGRSPSALKLGDFNGDGKTDVFQSNGGKWYVAYGGVGGWAEINDSGVKNHDLKIGDFNGDGKADVYYVEKLSSIN
jgi:hypothetical protein